MDSGAYLEEGEEVRRVVMGWRRRREGDGEGRTEEEEGGRWGKKERGFRKGKWRWRTYGGTGGRGGREGGTEGGCVYS